LERKKREQDAMHAEWLACRTQVAAMKKEREALAKRLGSQQELSARWAALKMKVASCETVESANG
jgi:hypothetical protein